MSTTKRKKLVGRVLQWIGRVFKDGIKKAAPIAVTITEAVKIALNSNVAGFLVKMLDGITHSHVPSDVLSEISKQLPKLLAVELAVVGLPDNPSEADILAFENRVLAAFQVYDNKSKFYTVFGAQVYGIIERTLEETPDVPPTFAEWVKAVEEAYQDYLRDKDQYGDQPDEQA